MRLRPVEFNLLWQRLGLPAKPLELNVPAHGVTLTEAARLTDEAAQSLRAQSLLVDDIPSPRIAGPLNTIAFPEAQLDLRWAVGVDVPEVRAIAAVRGKNVVLAVWNGESVAVRPIPRDTQADELVTTLGDYHAGGGRSVTSPSEVLLTASREPDPERFQNKLITGGLPRDDARAWRDFLTVPRLRAGQIGASAYDQWGKPTRARWVIHVFDTTWGRYATYERRGHRTVVAADRRLLVKVVADLYADTTRLVRNRQPGTR